MDFQMIKEQTVQANNSHKKSIQADNDAIKK